MRRQAVLFRVVNVPMRRILGLPFRTPLSKNLMLLYLTGRRTGKSYRQPGAMSPGRWALSPEPAAASAGASIRTSPGAPG